MALGALQSLQQAGRTVGKDVYLVGVDALSEAVQNVVDGNMTGTVLNDDVGQATAAAAATKLYVEGSKVEQYYWVTTSRSPRRTLHSTSSKQPKPYRCKVRSRNQ